MPSSATPTVLASPASQQLDLVERQFHQVAAFLAAGDAPHLQAAAALLQVLSVELPALLQAPPAPRSPPLTARQAALQRNARRQRVLAIARGLHMLRDNLSRQAAVNLQALKVVMPTPAKSTYSGGTSVYGAIARQSGAFTVLAA
jgi:hypothetical protein